MFNLNCKLIHFIHHVKERCGLDFTCIEKLLETLLVVWTCSQKLNVSYFYSIHNLNSKSDNIFIY